jgi:hypothetical protein
MLIYCLSTKIVAILIFLSYHEAMENIGLYQASGHRARESHS